MAIVQGYNSLFFASGLDNSGLLKGTLQAERMISSMASNIAKINPFAALAVGAGAAFGAVANDAFQMVKEFDKAMREVKTISEAAQNDYQGISNLVFDISKISPDTPKELAEAYYQVVSAGYDGAEGLELLAVASKSAVAGVTDTKTAVDGLTTILNAYKLSASETENVSDALFNTVKLGKTTMEELSASISQVAPIASASNIPLKEILSSVATLTKQGVPTAQAMTQIRSAIVGLSEAGKLDGAKTLQENMQALYDEMNGNQTAIQNEVGRIEAVQAILAVSGKNAKSAQGDLESYNNVIGATAKANREMLEENGNQWQLFSNRIKALTKGLGDTVLQASTGIAKGLNSIIEPSENVTESLENEAKQVYALYQQYLDSNTSIEDRKKILLELKDLSPSIVNGINDESDAYEILTSNIRLYTTELAKRKLFAEQQNDINIDKSKIVDLQYEIEKTNDQVTNAINEIASKGLGDEVNISIRNRFQNILEDQERSAIEKYKSIKKLIYDYNTAELQFVGLSKGNFIDNNIADVSLLNYDKKLEIISKKQKEVTAQQEVLNDKIRLSRDNKDNAPNVIAEINKVVSTDGLKAFQDFKFKTIKEAYETRIGVVSELEKIKEANNTVTGKNFVEKYLDSDDKEIAALAKEKYDSISKSLEGVSAKEVKRQQEELEEFKDHLKKKKEAYENYQNLLNGGFTEEAKQYKESLNLQQENYNEYLGTRLENAKSTQEKINLLQAGAFVGQSKTVIGTNGVKPVGYQNTNKEVGINPFNEDNVDVTLKKVYDVRDVLNEIRSGKKGLFNLKSTTSLLNKIKNVENSDLENKGEVLKELNADLNDSIAGGIQKVSGALSEASSLFSKFGDDATAKLLGQASGVASGIGRIASGDIVGGSLAVLNSGLTVEISSDTAKFEKAIEEFKESAIKISNSVKNSVGTDQANSKHNLIENLKDQEDKIKKAQEAEYKARKEVKFLGVKLGDKGAGSGTSPEKLEELSKQLDEAKQKVIELKEEYNSFITNTTKDTLGDAILQGLEEGKRGIKDFGDTFDKIITDSVLETFKREKLAEASKQFLDKFGELSDSDVGDLANQRNVIDNLKKERDAYYDQFVAFKKEAGNNKNNTEIQDKLQRMSDTYNQLQERIKEAQEKYDDINKGVGKSDLTTNEISELRGVFNDTVGKATKDFESLQDFLKKAGIDTSSLNGQKEQAGLSGSIRRELTEETGSELAGLYRGGYDLAKQHFALATQNLGVNQSILKQSIDSSVYLNQIQINTANTVARLDQLIDINTRIDINTQGNTTTTRDNGNVI